MKDGFPLEIVRENPKYGGTSGGRTLFQSHGMKDAEFVAKINYYLGKYGGGAGHEQPGQAGG